MRIQEMSQTGPPSFPAVIGVSISMQQERTNNSVKQHNQSLRRRKDLMWDRDQRNVHADTTPKPTPAACTHMPGRTLSCDQMSKPPDCCICLDEFTSPASLPCGHCFCLGCIGEYWRIHRACRCPVCKVFFPTRPQLKTDHAGVFTEEVITPFKAGEVPCDFCPEKQRAVKSCLECMASYCAAHLEPHYQNADLGRHLLISVVKNLEDSVCRLHGKQLSRFCRSDQTCICVMCVQAEHRGHHVISVNKEAAKKKLRLRRRSTRLQQAIQERLGKVEKIKLSTDLNPREARPQNNELIRQLEEEISGLQSRNTELEQLSQTEDSLHFLQRFLYSASS